MSAPNKPVDDYSPSTIPYTGGGAVKPNGQWIPSTKAMGDAIKDQTGQAQQRVAESTASGQLYIQRGGAIGVPTAPEKGRQLDSPPSVPLHASAKSAGHGGNAHHSSETTVFQRQPTYPPAIVAMPTDNNGGVTTASCLQALRNLNRKMEHAAGNTSASSKVGSAALPLFEAMKKLDGADEPSEDKGEGDDSEEVLTMKPHKEAKHRLSVSSTVAEAGDKDTTPQTAHKRPSTVSPKGPLSMAIRHKTFYNGNIPYPYTPQVSPEDSPNVSPSGSMSSIPAEATSEEKPAKGKLPRAPTPVPSSVAGPFKNDNALLYGNMDHLDVIIRRRRHRHPLESSTIWQRRPAATAAKDTIAKGKSVDNGWELVEVDDADEWDDCDRVCEA